MANLFGNGEKIYQVEDNMNIMIIGIDIDGMPSFLFKKGFTELGHNAFVVDVREVYSTLRNPIYDIEEYNRSKRLIPISHIIKALPPEKRDVDMVFCQQVWLHTINDLPRNIPVYYYHSEVQAPMTCLNPTHLGMGYSEAPNQLRRYYPRHYKSIQHKTFLWHGGDPSKYTPLKEGEEKIEGIHFFTNAKDRPEATREDSPYWSRNIYNFRDAVLQQYADEIIVHDWVELPEYQKLLPQFETIAVIQGNGCYPSQRVFEALYAGCRVKIFHENVHSQTVFQSLGPLTHEHFIKHHTYLQRAQQVLEEVKHVRN